MPRFAFQHAVEIQAPAAKVWDVLTDFPRYGEWNGFVSECRCDLRPAGLIQMTVHLGPKPQKVEEVINAVQPGVGFNYSMKPAPLGMLKSLRAHRIEPIAQGKCRYVSEFELTGPMALVLKLLLGKRLEAGFADMTQGIKRRAEALAR